jgi:hypothetical protein
MVDGDVEHRLSRTCDTCRMVAESGNDGGYQCRSTFHVHLEEEKSFKHAPVRTGADTELCDPGSRCDAIVESSLRARAGMIR